MMPTNPLNGEDHSKRRRALQDVSNRSSLSRFSRSYVPKKLVQLRKDTRQSQQTVDKNDPLCKDDYIHEMYEHFAASEATTSVRPLYMEEQKQLNELMRAILIDWVVDVHYSYRLSLATLYLTVNLIDRYLEASPEVARKEFQLLGTTALWIASKYEEIRPMEINQLVEVCDCCYTKHQVFAKEGDILNTLHYRLCVPTSLTFLLRFLKAAKANRKMAHMSMFILEGTLGCYNLLHYLPSQMAAASIYIARATLLTGQPAWTKLLAEYTGFSKTDVLPVAKAIWTESNANVNMKLQAVRKKYSTVEYSSVAQIPLKGI
mmetsp:Transcript_5114/g.12219  ORF Transcript_5114/g.12219 Transcript_5114/m.12219 type:complete len:318 (+) Transcript_5114:68-1021(+)